MLYVNAQVCNNSHFCKLNWAAVLLQGTAHPQDESKYGTNNWASVRVRNDQMA